jgi:predicted AAA+ superfamily ATPase
MKPLYELCTPRPDVLKGAIKESDFAADLALVLRGDAPDEYAKPAIFFANTHPTAGVRHLLANVCRRLSRAGGEASAIFRLDTQYGGGKTHSLIALSHAARGAASVANIAEFVDPGLLPRGEVRVAAFDGENADPRYGRPLGGGLRARTPWGELAYALAGVAGYENDGCLLGGEPVAGRPDGRSPGRRSPQGDAPRPHRRE